MSRPLWIAAPLVFGSGLCSLVYQMVWTRELRLVFGASTAATSAVVAIFVGGLCLGGLVFGGRLERSAQPLRYYARLELAIAVLSALTPWLVDGVRMVYVWSGGSVRLGHGGSNLLRLLLAGLVLLPPTFAMGGTLPALARAVEDDGDRGRRAVAAMYAINTLGAVCGCALTTFVWLEAFGNRTSLYLACGLNLLIGGLAYAASLRWPHSAAAAAEERSAGDIATPAWFAYTSAAVVGFAFFLMELVWYRALGPLLGGSVFTFGVILCVALAGIGCGSAIYAAFDASRPRRLVGFALSCAAEAVLIALPYALGDRLALAALFLQPFATIGFAGLVLGWLVIAICVVFPAALLAGLQFPLLIALLGQGRLNVARHVGSAYAANTLGAIVGALAGGFGLLPMLGALGAWRAVSALLAGWSLVALAVEFARSRERRPLWSGLAVLLLSAAGFALLGADGPSAVFRHSPIGVGRVALSQFDSPNSITSFLNQERRSVDWQADGVESAVAITHYDGVSFIVNGKSDGSALTDAPTQVMSGLLGAALAPHAKKALVIGLGTGSTAGWLASAPGIERVDVAEIEPVITQVAKRCAPVNQDALNNPKLHVLRGDARELLSVLQTQYDVIFSEPSNPYRAGIASMYAQEFYRAVQKRLAPGGVFVQWLQIYDVDAISVRSVYATLSSVFPFVETWYGLKEDLLLVATREEPKHDVPALRARLAQEPYARALRLAWHTTGLEGLFSHFVANPSFAAAMRAGDVRINTDDVSPVEFGFARNARGSANFAAGSLYSAVLARGAGRPNVRGGDVDWALADYEREAFAVVMGSAGLPELVSGVYRTRLAMLQKWAAGDFTSALGMFAVSGLRDDDPRLTVIERLARAELLAYEGSIESERSIEALLADRPTEATLLHAVYLLRHGRRKAGTDMLVSALQRYRSDPWPYPLPIARALNGLQIGDASDHVLAARWLEALAPPFALRVNETARDRARLRLAYALGARHRACVGVFESFEPYPPWVENMLRFRSDCYETHDHALRDQAARDLARFRALAPAEFSMPPR